jgi:hypothetical protein
VYPSSLADVIEICRERDHSPRLKAAGSHWALSEAAISDHTFIETHDPTGAHNAMGRTLTNVIPRCLNRGYLQHMKDAASDGRWYLVHIEAGKRIYQLYAELDQLIDVGDHGTLAGVLNRDFGDPGFGGPWAFQTLGGAGGQTVVGALTTGTHGGDFDRAPVADAVVAIHLVADGGRHYWIEPNAPPEPQLTDDFMLSVEFTVPALGGPGHFEVIRDNDVFNAVLVSAGRFGVIYSIVVKAIPQYALHEKRRLHLWQDIKRDLTNPVSPLYRDVPPGGTDGPQRFLQVAVSLTPIANFQRNLVGITKRWDVPMSLLGINGQAERVGEPLGFDEHIGAVRFTNAGTTHPYAPAGDDLNRSGGPSMLEKACADPDFARGILTQAVGELAAFVDSGGTIAGAALAAVAAVGGGGILVLLAALAAVIQVLRDLIDGIDDDTRFGEVMERAKNKLLDPSETDAIKRGAGLLAWQLIFYLAFKDQQSERDFSAVSYAVMDIHDYRDRSCTVNVDSIEVFFDGTDDRYVAFIDALIAFETGQEILGRAFVGYASLRFTQDTGALIGMQRWPLTCGIEIACLKDVSGGQELIEYALEWVRNPNNGGILHWGQHHNASRTDTERLFGERLARWRSALGRLTAGGDLDRFSSAFTTRTGLEVS